ncbi:hypothetical protein KP509_17G075300 [Ceratopteris richardii]|uniref:Methyltransferase n=2 Tax=Ceratopteris richardii TaxID=49495 RepID=A0A8T2SZK1_CERRI|nr:hypothetical protein KP509_17G075300 [Ceratopteris richardii]
MGTSTQKKQGNQWKLLDYVMGTLFVSVFVFLVLVYTPLGDSFAASGRRSLAFSFKDSRNRDKLLSVVEAGEPLEACPQELQDHMPCEDPKRARFFSKERNYYRERHCPPPSEKMLCLIPPPKGYKPPITWPESLHKIWYSNMPHSKIAERKGHQGWMKEQGSYFIFPGGGTMFSDGARQYIEKLEGILPLNDGSVRTALDIGSGVASFGGYMLEKDVLTLSFAPRDSHKAQIQFALERGIPAFVAMLGTHRLPFPAFAFDLAHCSRCLISFSSYNGSYFLEVDRLLRPGAYFVLSGPPVQWSKQENEWRSLQDFARNMCYEMLFVEGNTAIWQKPLNHSCLIRRKQVHLCNKKDDPNASWYVPLKDCVSRLPTSLKQGVPEDLTPPKWPKRLSYPPKRLSVVPHGDKAILLEADMHRWERRVKYYKELLGLALGTSRMRNIIDMNAVFGGFAAALIGDPIWVMNVVPTSSLNTLPVIYDRGLIGVVHDWCEAFSTYPRTYDLIHVVNLKSTIMDTTGEIDRCNLVDVILEMDRILRPNGMVVIRDTPDMLEKAMRIVSAVRWTGSTHDAERESSGKEKILVAKKSFPTST